MSGSNPGPYAMTAYKHHIRDPVVWWDTFELTARNYDHNGVVSQGGDVRDVRDGDAKSGANTNGKSNHFKIKSDVLDFQPVVMSSYAWYYEW